MVTFYHMSVASFGHLYAAVENDPS